MNTFQTSNRHNFFAGLIASTLLIGSALFVATEIPQTAFV